MEWEEEENETREEQGGVAEIDWSGLAAALAALPVQKRLDLEDMQDYVRVLSPSLLDHL
jgi:hypothetical protein